MAASTNLTATITVSNIEGRISYTIEFSNGDVLTPSETADFTSRKGAMAYAKKHAASYAARLKEEAAESETCTLSF